MSKKYPRFGEVYKHYSIQARQQPTLPKCELCGDTTVAGINMQVDYMRGNDEFFRVCKEHLELAKLDGTAFYAKYWTYRDEQEKGDNSDG